MKKAKFNIGDIIQAKTENERYHYCEVAVVTGIEWVVSDGVQEIRYHLSSGSLVYIDEGVTINKVGRLFKMPTLKLVSLTKKNRANRKASEWYDI